MKKALCVAIVLLTHLTQLSYTADSQPGEQVTPSAPAAPSAPLPDAATPSTPLEKKEEQKLTLSDSRAEAYLRWAARTQDPIAMHKILQENKDTVNIDAADQNGHTALHILCKVDPTNADRLVSAAECVQVLLNAKANPTLKDNEGHTPLWHAVKQRQIRNEESINRIGRLLTARIPIDAESFALAEKRVEKALFPDSMDRLISRCFTLAQAGNYASINNELVGSYIRTLDHNGFARLVKEGVDVNIKGVQYGKTLLHTISDLYPKNHALAFTRAILDAKGDPNVADHRGNTPLLCALSRSRPDIALTLLIGGATVTPGIIQLAQQERKSMFSDKAMTEAVLLALNKAPKQPQKLPSK